MGRVRWGGTVWECANLHQRLPFLHRNAAVNSECLYSFRCRNRLHRVQHRFVVTEEKNPAADVGSISKEKIQCCRKIKQRKPSRPGTAMKQKQTAC